MTMAQPGSRLISDVLLRKAEPKRLCNSAVEKLRPILWEKKLKIPVRRLSRVGIQSPTTDDLCRVEPGGHGPARRTCVVQFFKNAETRRELAPLQSCNRGLNSCNPCSFF